MTENSLDYSQLVDRAMQSVIREVLKMSEADGLPGKHHFYITVNTTHPGVEISDELRAQYNQEITIVLEHQFWNLSVNEEWFSVSLKFNRRMQKIKVPYEAITAFVDPSVNFGLQFASFTSEKEFAGKNQDNKPEKNLETLEEVAKPSIKSSKAAEIVTLDNFRKKTD